MKKPSSRIRNYLINLFIVIASFVRGDLTLLILFCYKMHLLLPYSLIKANYGIKLCSDQEFFVFMMTEFGSILCCFTAVM